MSQPFIVRMVNHIDLREDDPKEAVFALLEFAANSPHYQQVEDALLTKIGKHGWYYFLESEGKDNSGGNIYAKWCEVIEGYLEEKDDSVGLAGSSAHLLDILHYAPPGVFVIYQGGISTCERCAHTQATTTEAEVCGRCLNGALDVALPTNKDDDIARVMIVNAKIRNSPVRKDEDIMPSPVTIRAMCARGRWRDYASKIHPGPNFR